MNDRGDSSTEKPRRRGEEGEDSLPPLDHDETPVVDPAEFASYLENFEEEEPAGEVPMEDELELSESLIGEDESSWLGEDEEKTPLDVELELTNDEHSWLENDEEQKALLVEDWFIDEDVEKDLLSDDDSEGPLSKESYQIEPETWDSLDDDEADEDDIEIWESMERLGITLLETPSDDVIQTGEEDFPDAVFLGPSGGGITAAVFAGGAPIAVGEGIFVLGADGMFHETEASARVAETLATSVCWDGEIVFIGTRHRGAFATMDRGATLIALNSWYTQGLNGSGDLSMDELSTSFEVFGQDFLGGFRLLGRTGEGQLFQSLDWGTSWMGPILKGRCSSIIPVGGGNELMVVAESAEKGPALLRSPDLVQWETVETPQNLTLNSTNYPVHIAACRNTIIAGCSSPGTPLYRSLDRGASWAPVLQASCISAVLIDPEEPNWIAVASYNEKQGLSTIRVSEDGGDKWQRVFVTKPSSKGANTLPGGDASDAGIIIGLNINPTKVSELLAVTGRGAYLLNLTRRGRAH